MLADNFEGIELKKAQTSTSQGERKKDFAIPLGVQDIHRRKHFESGPEIRHIGPAIEPELLAIYRTENEAVKKQYEMFKETQAPHLKQSRQEILETAKAAYNPEAQDQNAVILGLGNGLDIPLEELAKRYRVTIVEADKETALETVKSLPKELQSKITITIADLTGVGGAYCQSIKNAFDNQTSPKRFKRELLNVVDDIKKKIPEGTPDVGSGYAFVCSHLVSSQLHSIPDKYLGAFNVMPAIEATYHEFQKSEQAKSLRYLLQQEHLQYLKRLVAPSGTVHFADTYMLVRNPESNHPQRQVMLHPKNINPVLDTNFEKVKEPAEWMFNQTPSKRQDARGFVPQRYLVKSFSLKAKSSENRPGTEIHAKLGHRDNG